MVVPKREASSAADRHRKYYSHATGGVNQAVKDSTDSWKWINVFSTDTLDRETTLKSGLDLSVDSGQKFVVKSQFRQYGKATVRTGAVLYVSHTDYYLGYQAKTADRGAIFTMEPGSILVLDHAILHVQYGSTFTVPDGAIVHFIDGGAISYEPGPESADISGSYETDDSTGKLSDGTQIKAPVLKKFYEQNVDLSTYAFHESRAEYYNDGDVIGDSSSFEFFTKNLALSDGDYVEREAVLWYVLNYFYDRNLLSIPVKTTLNPESGLDSIDLDVKEISVRYGLAIPKTRFKNLSSSTAIPRTVSVNGTDYQSTDFSDADGYFIPGGIASDGKDDVTVRFDHLYDVKFSYCGKIVDARIIWRGNLTADIEEENVFTVNGEPFTVNGEDYDLKSGFTFVGWFEQGATEAFDFSAPITHDVALTGRETPT